MTGIEPGNQVSLETLPFQDVPVEPAWESAMFSFMGFTLLGIFTVSLVKNLLFGASDKSELESTAYAGERKTLFYSKCAFCTTTDHQCEICEKISPRDYHLISWFGAPVPDYSFAIESESKERKIDDVLKRLKEGVDGIQQSENFRNFLLTMSKFHNYSIGNLILIMLQKPEATRVAGFSTWKDLYRWVKKGEKGIVILAPCMPPKGSKPEATEAQRISEQDILTALGGLPDKSKHCALLSANTLKAAIREYIGMKRS